MNNYTGKNVVIVGLGMTGLSCVNYFLSKNVIPRVIDTRSHPQGLEQLDKRIQYHVGHLHQTWLLEADLIVMSPGISLATPEIAKAIEQGIEVVGDVELFCREINQKTNKKIVAITGSNGKTTVTTLMGDIAKHAGINVGIGGNIGMPALLLLKQDYELYILELSSFQLETTTSLQADVATILNITEDHMDRYPQGLEQYRKAKLRIYDQAKYCIVNHDDPLTYPPILASQSKLIEVGIKNGRYCLNDTHTALCVDGKKVLDVNQIGITGIHNYINCLSVLAMTDCLQISRSAVIEVLGTFNGLSHRFQVIHQHNNIVWINDSKATNVGSTVAALKSVSIKKTLHLLLGGDGKAADFSPLIPYLSHDRIKMYCFGRDRQLLAALNSDNAIMTETLEQAMQIIAQQVTEGDIVLLSPACASLDQFCNYEQRGNVFACLARELAK